MSKTKTTGLVLTWNAVAVGAVTDLAINGNPVTKINITSYEDLLMKYRPGKKDLNEMSFTVQMNQDDAVQEDLEDDRFTNTQRAVTVVYPSGTLKTLTVQAKVANFQWGAPDGNGTFMANLTLQQMTLPVRS